ncbi:hypothetical protein VPHK460_0008 [Vibrio phage K460]
MSEIVYNILRKCVESPENVSYDCSADYKHWTFHYVKISGTSVVQMQTCKRTDTTLSTGNKLTDKECRRILRGMEHVQAMKIRRL